MKLGDLEAGEKFERLSAIWTLLYKARYRALVRCDSDGAECIFNQKDEVTPYPPRPDVKVGDVIRAIAKDPGCGAPLLEGTVLEIASDKMSYIPTNTSMVCGIELSDYDIEVLRRPSDGE